MPNYSSTGSKCSAITYVRAVPKYSSTASKMRRNSLCPSCAKYSSTSSKYGAITSVQVHSVQAVPKSGPHLRRSKLFSSPKPSSAQTLLQTPRYARIKAMTKRIIARPDTFSGLHDATLSSPTKRPQNGHGCFSLCASHAYTKAFPSTSLYPFLLQHANLCREMQPNQHRVPLGTQSKLCCSCTTKHNTECISTPPSTMCSLLHQHT